jgi:hypothetical protein
MTHREHVLKSFPEAVAEELPRVEGKKREWIVTASGKRLSREYSEAKAWKEAMLKIEEGSERMFKNGMTRKAGRY